MPDIGGTDPVGAERLVRETRVSEPADSEGGVAEGL